MKNIIYFVLLACITFINSNAQTDITQDIGWPRQVSNSQATLIYYQPQIDKWDNYKKMSGKMAFGLTPTGKQEILGVVSFTSDTKTDKDARTTYLHNIDYTDVRFPSLDSNTAESMKKIFLNIAPRNSESYSIDRIMAELNGQGQVKAQTVQTKNDPPKIFYSASPAILLTVDGAPVLSPIDKTDMQFVVNTNWDLFFEKATKSYFLLVNDVWLTATNLQGTWKQTHTLPKDMSVLPSGQNFDDVKKQIPPRATTDAPEVFYSNEPAELILTEGTPVFSKIPGTGLLYVSNSDNDVFVDEAQNQYYILLSGRWFRSKAFGGPWTYAGNDLPADFAKIPEDSPKGQVLASVPGTIQASDAVMLAQIPTTVVVNKAEAETKAKATYDGDPNFAPIQGTSMEYATNTQDKIIKVGDLYYMCFQAVWFMSTTPNGPWKTADSVPDEIYTIPPSSPVYNVIYVTQTNPTPTTVECSSTSGYLGAFIIGATVGAIVSTAIVYGTGWYYPPYIFWPPGGFYPVYHPWPCTYGVGAVYNPWTGGFAAGRRVYGPYGAVGTAAWYNPATGRYGRSASIQGWYGGRTAANTYNPWTGAYGHTNQGHNPYAQWGHSTVSNGYQWARSGHVTTAHGTAFGYQTSGGKEGIITHGANGTIAHTNNSIYAGHDGNVYRKNSTGNWSRYNNGNWNQINHNIGTEHQSTGILQNLERSAQSRERGVTQSSRFQIFQRNGRHR
ncbi:MAG: hypothetical protein LBV72_17570 [Tannerella sp.]|jgi:hypothetical protein|nr:hypothetical protein [Tannerella sp.]